MESLREIFESHEGFSLNKWNHYIDIYDKFFHKYRNTPVVFLEIGIAHGGSLQMWRKYFGEKAIIIGIDVNPECKRFEGGNTKIFIGSQEDKTFLSELKKQIPAVDILLDDGGHTMKQQITTFEMLYDHIKQDGIYACEDLHTSYWSEYGGGLKKKKSFIEYTKNFIDNLHGWHHRNKKMFNKITESAYGLHYYDSIFLIERKQMIPPANLTKGIPQIKQQQEFANYGHSTTLKSVVKKVIGKK